MNSTAVAETLTSRPLTSDEISRATQYLVSTRENLVNATGKCSEEQFHYKPAADRWSIAEILEHITIIEYAVHAIIGRMPQAPADAGDRNHSEIEEFIVANVPLRTGKIVAPEAICPKGQWPPEESLQRFVDGRTKMLQLLAEAPALRGHIVPHPILGDWDGYQWILAAAGHSARHTAQIVEVKACSNFPAS